MGLDITWYSNVVKALPGEGEDKDGDADWEAGWDRVFHNDSFPGRAEGLEDRALYKCSGESDGFIAGSYSGYNFWRRELAKMAGYEPVPYSHFGEPEEPRHDAGAWAATEGPFWELINFSDCEGVIGPIVSAKLAKDFSDFQEKADEVPVQWFQETYANFRKAFEGAAQNGYVSFH